MGAASLVRPLLYVALVGCGAHALLRLITGKGLVARLRELAATENHVEHPLPPSDPIDEASWESFPASDPPAISPK